tara:strand:- start:1138 stop:2169 length:1032 start_codon:yes stop_codon:yes gene_type:complete
MNEFQLPIFAVFILAFIISLLLNKLSLNFKYFSKQDIDNQKRLSSLKIPTYGGISMSLAFLVSTRLLGKADFEIIQIAIYAVVITFIGIVDDRYNLIWKVKLLLQLVAVSTPIYLLDIYLNVEQLFGINLNNFLNLFSTVVWILLIVNSLNFLDNMDGLAATIASMIAISMAILSFITDQYKLTDLSIVLIASMLGFLYFNIPKAKIYMGDSGSLFLGYCLGFISILFSWNSDMESSWIFQIQPVILFFTIPIIDFLTVTISRIKSGNSPMTGGTDHISHRLLKKGFTNNQVLFIFVLLSLIILIITLGIIYLNKIISLIFLFIYIFLVIASLIYFLNLEILD